MKILLISASPRKERSQTLLLAKEVLKGCPEVNPESEIINLADSEIGFCWHNEDCHKKILNCLLKDDVTEILKKMLEADGIILATPNYINQVAAPMKALFDRSTHFIHCRRLLGKYIAGVVCSGSGQNKEVLEYLKFYANTCGAQYSGDVSARAPVDAEKLKEAYKLGQRLCADIREKRTYPDQIKTIESGKEYFRPVIQLRKNEWPGEYQYWKDKGWL